MPAAEPVSFHDLHGSRRPDKHRPNVRCARAPARHDSCTAALRRPTVRAKPSAPCGGYQQQQMSRPTGHLKMARRFQEASTATSSRDFQAFIIGFSVVWWLHQMMMEAAGSPSEKTRETDEHRAANTSPNTRFGGIPSNRHTGRACKAGESAPTRAARRSPTRVRRTPNSRAANSGHPASALTR